MAKLAWASVGQKIYETGTDRGVLYLQDTSGRYTKSAAWSGLISVKQTPEGGESTQNFADNSDYLNLTSAEKFKATIEAYAYPPEFAACDGTKEIATGVTIGQQTRIPFGFSYRTLIGNDTKGTDFGYKIHIIYGAKAAVSSKDYATVNDNPEAITFSWSVSSSSVNVPGAKPTSILTVNTLFTSAEGVKAIENALYGTESSEPYLPTPAEVIELLTETGDVVED